MESNVSPISLSKLAALCLPICKCIQHNDKLLCPNTLKRAARKALLLATCEYPQQGQPSFRFGVFCGQAALSSKCPQTSPTEGLNILKSSPDSSSYENQGYSPSRSICDEENSCPLTIPNNEEGTFSLSSQSYSPWVPTCPSSANDCESYLPLDSSYDQGIYSPLSYDEESYSPNYWQGVPTYSPRYTVTPPSPSYLPSTPSYDYESFSNQTHSRWAPTYSPRHMPSSPNYEQSSPSFDYDSFSP